MPNSIPSLACIFHSVIMTVRLFSQSIYPSSQIIRAASVRAVHPNGCCVVLFSPKMKLNKKFGCFSKGVGGGGYALRTPDPEKPFHRNVHILCCHLHSYTNAAASHHHHHPPPPYVTKYTENNEGGHRQSAIPLAQNNIATSYLQLSSALALSSSHLVSRLRSSSFGSQPCIFRRDAFNTYWEINKNRGPDAKLPSQISSS